MPGLISRLATSGTTRTDLINELDRPLSGAVVAAARYQRHSSSRLRRASVKRRTASEKDSNFWLLLVRSRVGAALVRETAEFAIARRAHEFSYPEAH